MIFCRVAWRGGVASFDLARAAFHLGILEPAWERRADVRSGRGVRGYRQSNMNENKELPDGFS
jgi:hypothetical protein